MSLSASDRSRRRRSQAKAVIGRLKRRSVPVLASTALLTGVVSGMVALTSEQALAACTSPDSYTFGTGLSCTDPGTYTNPATLVINLGGDGLTIETTVDGDVSYGNEKRVILGFWDGVDVKGISDGDLVFDNWKGLVGGFGEGIDISDVAGNVTIDNEDGKSAPTFSELEGLLGLVPAEFQDITDLWGGEGGIYSRQSAVKADDVTGRFTLDNDNGIVFSVEANGVDLNDIDGGARVDNRFGSIEGGENGIIGTDIDDDVRIDNRFWGLIVGNDEDGIHLADINGDVTVKNAVFGSIYGDDDGIWMHDVEGEVIIDNSWFGDIEGEHGDGIRLDDIDEVAIDNSHGGDITGDDNGIRITDVRDGDVWIDNSHHGDITGWDGDGIRIDDVWDGDVAIRNSDGGEIRGRDGDGISGEEIDGHVWIANSDGEISGKYDGIDLDGVEDWIYIDNRDGEITGRRDNGIEISDADDDVKIDNRYGGDIYGDANGVWMDDVEGKVTIDNRYGGSIEGEDENGIRLNDVDDDIKIYNSRGGDISGDRNGIRITDVYRGDVWIDNSHWGDITGWDGDGIDISDVKKGDVGIDNSSHGEIRGKDGDGIVGDDIDGHVWISNAFGGEIAGREDGIDLNNVDDWIYVDNRKGDITGYRDNGIEISNAGDDVKIDNRYGGDIYGDANGIWMDDVEGKVTIDNSYRGSIEGEDENGIRLNDVDDDIKIYNDHGGDISGDRNGIRITDVYRGDVWIDNSHWGDITGWDGDGIDISDVKKGDVGIDNSDHGEIRGKDGDGIVGDDIDGHVWISNAFGGEISGKHDGIDLNNVDDWIYIDNRNGDITGYRDNGIEISNADDDVKVDNRYGGDIYGDANGIWMDDVEGKVTIDNSYRGSIEGEDENGIRLNDVDGGIKIYNDHGGDISGDRNGIRITDVYRGDVWIDNSHWGDITGWDGDGIDISDVKGWADVGIDNSHHGEIRGRDGDGISGDDIHGHVWISNAFGGEISGKWDGIDLNDVDDWIYVGNQGGDITGWRDNGIEITDAGDDVTVDNRFGGSVYGRDDGIKMDEVEGAVTIDNRFGGEIEGERKHGVHLNDVDDDVAIYNSFGGAITGDDHAVLITDVWQGDVTVTNSFGGEIRSWKDGDAIHIAEVDGGNVAVWNLFGGDISGKWDGVDISEVDGNVYVNNAGDGSIEGRNGTGIQIADVSGDVTIDNSFGGTVTGKQDGIYVRADGDIDIESYAGTITATSGYGIDARSTSIDGNIWIDGGDITANLKGILAVTDDGDIDIDQWGDISSATDDGIRAQSDAGTVDVSLYGDIDAGNGRGDAGIEALTNTGAISIYTWGGSNITSTDIGIDTVSFVSGNIGIEADGDIDAAGHGIRSWVQGTGAVDISVGSFAAIRSQNGSAIDVLIDGSNDSSTATVENAGLLLAQGGFSAATVHVETVDGATIGNTGLITSFTLDPEDETTLIPAAGVLVLDVDGGAAVVNNDGTIIGRIALTDEGDTFNNTSVNTWTVTGDNYFEDGDDRAYNSGRIEAFNATNFISLEDFYNYLNGDPNAVGAIDLLDGDTGEILTTSGNYHGGNGSILAVDADIRLGGTADVFRVAGNADGRTYVSISDLTPSAQGEYLPDGILIVDVEGSVEGQQNFQLANGPITKGFFDYNLVLDSSSGDNEWYLRSDPNATAQDVPELSVAALSAWQASISVWSDRSVDLRAYYAGGDGPEVAAADPDVMDQMLAEDAPVMGAPTSTLREGGAAGAWGRAFGVGASWDDTDERTFGFQGGIDVPVSITENGAFIVGALAGYSHTALTFGSSDSDDATLSGPMIGAYASFIDGPFYADALIKVDFLSIEYGAMGESADTNGISYGGRVEAGYRFDVTPSTFVEPRASLAYVATDIDDFDILGNTVSFDGGDSLQGTIGFRAGTALDGGDGMTIVPYLTADIGNEFLGDASASFDAGGAVAEVDDEAGIDGVFGQVGVGIDLVDLGDGISAFAKGNYRFAEDYNSLSGNVGVRIAW